MTLRLAIAVAIAGLLSLTHWKAYLMGGDSVRVEWQSERIEFDKAARAKEQTYTKQLEEARNEATKREAKLRTDAAVARRSADGLRGDLEELRRQLPDLAADACRQRADTLAELFGSCTEDYRGLAETADRLNSDRQTLMDAWPK